MTLKPKPVESSCGLRNDRPRRFQSATPPRYKLAPPPKSLDDTFDTSDTDCSDDFVNDDPIGTDLDSGKEDEEDLHYKDYHHFKDENVRRNRAVDSFGRMRPGPLLSTLLPVRTAGGRRWLLMSSLYREICL